MTTTANTCLEFQAANGCKRTKCVKFHFSLGMIVDSLPNAPNGPPCLIGHVPANIKSHRIMQNQRFEWSKEEDAKNQYALLEQQRQTLEELKKIEQLNSQYGQT